MTRSIRGPAALRRLPALLRRDILSANLAIGTAGVFVFVTAAASLAIDRERSAAPAEGSWSLRGSLSKVETRDRTPTASSQHEFVARNALARL